MATGKPLWLKVVIGLSIVFGLVGIVAGGWMFAPLILLGIVLLVLMPKLGGVRPTPRD